MLIDEDVTNVHRFAVPQLAFSVRVFRHVLVIGGTIRHSYVTGMFMVSDRSRAFARLPPNPAKLLYATDVVTLFRSRQDVCALGLKQSAGREESSPNQCKLQPGKDYRVIYNRSLRNSNKALAGLEHCIDKDL